MPATNETRLENTSPTNSAKELYDGAAEEDGSARPGKNVGPSVSLTTMPPPVSHGSTIPNPVSGLDLGELGEAFGRAFRAAFTDTNNLTSPLVRTSPSELSSAAGVYPRLPDSAIVPAVSERAKPTLTSIVSTHPSTSQEIEVVRPADSEDTVMLPAVAGNKELDRIDETSSKDASKKEAISGPPRPSLPPAVMEARTDAVLRSVLSRLPKKTTAVGALVLFPLLGGVIGYDQLSGTDVSTAAAANLGTTDLSGNIIDCNAPIATVSFPTTTARVSFPVKTTDGHETPLKFSTSSGGVAYPQVTEQGSARLAICPTDELTDKADKTPIFTVNNTTGKVTVHLSALSIESFYAKPTCSKTAEFSVCTPTLSAIPKVSNLPQSEAQRVFAAMEKNGTSNDATLFRDTIAHLIEAGNAHHIDTNPALTAQVRGAARTAIQNMLQDRGIAGKNVTFLGKPASLASTFANIQGARGTSQFQVLPFMNAPAPKITASAGSTS